MQFQLQITSISGIQIPCIFYSRNVYVRIQKITRSNELAPKFIRTRCYRLVRRSDFLQLDEQHLITANKSDQVKLTVCRERPLFQDAELGSVTLDLEHLDQKDLRNLPVIDRKGKQKGILAMYVWTDFYEVDTEAASEDTIRMRGDSDFLPMLKISEKC